MTKYCIYCGQPAVQDEADDYHCCGYTNHTADRPLDNCEVCHGARGERMAVLIRALREIAGGGYNEEGCVQIATEALGALDSDYLDWLDPAAPTGAA